MSLLAFIGDSDKSSQEEIINLLRTVKNLDEFRNINNSDLFSDPQRIYIIIDDLVIDIPREEEEDKTWSDLDVREIKEYLKSVPFWIGDKVIKIGDENNTFEIVNVGLNLNNEIIYKLNSPNSWALAEELSFAITLETVGYKCNHCGKILRSRKPHMCNGNYRCKKLSFTPIQEDLGYIEIPEGYKFSHFEGNKIRLIKVI